MVLGFFNFYIYPVLSYFSTFLNPSNREFLYARSTVASLLYKVVVWFFLKLHVGPGLVVGHFMILPSLVDRHAATSLYIKVS